MLCKVYKCKGNDNIKCVDLVLYIVCYFYFYLNDMFVFVV